MTFERGLTPGSGLDSMVPLLRPKAPPCTPVNEENVAGHIGPESPKSLPALGFASRGVPGLATAGRLSPSGWFAALVAAD